jgi:hypothetical protein
VTIRGKLYTAIVLTILGPLATTAVALVTANDIARLALEGERRAKRRPGAAA